MSQTDLSAPQAPSQLRSWGFWAVLIGALALALGFVQIAAPSFEARLSAAQQVGEISGEIKRSAWRSFLGLRQPEVTPEPVRATAYLALAAPLLGIAAVVLSLISGVLRENWRFAVYGVGLGATAIVFQYLWWLALLVAAVVLMVTIIANIGDIFSFW